jgi:hypothetical protein
VSLLHQRSCTVMLNAEMATKVIVQKIMCFHVKDVFRKKIVNRKKQPKTLKICIEETKKHREEKEAIENIKNGKFKKRLKRNK